MDINMYEKYIKNRMNNEISFWDKKARDFAERVPDLRKYKDHCLFDTLNACKVFEDAHTVLDVGCGIGVHSYYFNKYVDSYLGIDASSGMIEQCLINKEKYSLTNCYFKNISLNECDENADLVFVSMCPAVNEVADVEHLLALSNRYVIMKRYLKDIYSFDEILGFPVHKAHNDPLYSYGLINIFWKLGYVPAVFIKHMVDESSLTLEKAMLLYKKPMSKLSEEKRQAVSNKIQEIFSKQSKIDAVMKCDIAIIVVDKNILHGKIDEIN